MSNDILPVKVLYIDDDLTLLMIARMALKQSKFALVKGVSSGKEGLSYLQESLNKPDLILLDAIMPEMDGVETCIKIKNSAGMENIPIIFMTAHTHPDEIQRLQALNPIGIIYKPFDPMNLAEKIDEFLSLFNQSSMLIKDEQFMKNDVVHRDELNSLKPVYLVQLKKYLDELCMFEEKYKSNVATDQHYQDLAFLTHKMVGSGELFGYSTISKQARKIEVSIMNHQFSIIDLDELISLCKEII